MKKASKSKKKDEKGLGGKKKKATTYELSTEGLQRQGQRGKRAPVEGTHINTAARSRVITARSLA